MSGRGGGEGKEGRGSDVVLTSPSYRKRQAQPLANLSPSPSLPPSLSLPLSLPLSLSLSPLSLVPSRSHSHKHTRICAGVGSHSECLTGLACGPVCKGCSQQSWSPYNEGRTSTHTHPGKRCDIHSWPIWFPTPTCHSSSARRNSRAGNRGLLQGRGKEEPRVQRHLIAQTA